MSEGAGPLPRLLYQDLVRRALAEDLGGAGDLTTEAIVPGGLRGSGGIVFREAGCVAGLEPALFAFQELDDSAHFEVLRPDGSDVEAGAVVARIQGTVRALLTAERTALNLLGRLSGIATATRLLVRQIAGLDCRISCTRKTTPGLRALEKYAVRVGGGSNHRFGLDDAVLIKDNHLAVAGSVAEAISRVRRAVGHLVPVEVEVETLDQLREALALPIDAVLLDNMDLDTLRQAVRLVAGAVTVEASGGITEESVRGVAATGVDVVSVGWITHSAPAIDVSFEIAEEALPSGL